MKLPSLLFASAFARATARLALCSLLFISATCIAAQMANVEFTHLFINAKTGVTVPINPIQTNTAQAINVHYLLAAIDKLNELSVASQNTNLQAHSLATQQVADIVAVADAVNRLFNCNVGGYWKQVIPGSGNHLIDGGPSDGSGTGGSVTCQTCTQDYYCPMDQDIRISCETIGSGYVTSGTGAVSPSECQPPIYCPAGGQYWTGSTCSTCPTGSFCPSGQDTTVSCDTLPGVNPAGGSYTSASPYSTDTDCRYTAPNKSITGCSGVTPQQVSYNGSTWPASTYGVSATAGYYIQNNNTSSATCTICPKDYYCTGGSNAAVACSSVCSGCTTTGTGATAASQCTSPVPGVSE